MVVYKKYSGSCEKGEGWVVATYGLGTDRSARIVYCLMARTVPVVLRGGLKNIEVHHFPWAYLQNAGRVSTSVTVVWGGPHGRQVVIKQGRVAFHAKLMSAEDMRHPIRLEEFVDHPRPKRVTRASVRYNTKARKPPSVDRLGIAREEKKRR